MIVFSYTNVVSVESPEWVYVLVRYLKIDWLCMRIPFKDYKHGLRAFILSMEGSKDRYFLRFVRMFLYAMMEKNERQDDWFSKMKSKYQISRKRYSKYRCNEDEVQFENSNVFMFITQRHEGLHNDFYNRVAEYKKSIPRSPERCLELYNRIGHLSRQERPKADDRILRWKCRRAIMFANKESPSMRDVLKCMDELKLHAADVTTIDELINTGSALVGKEMASKFKKNVESAVSASTLTDYITYFQTSNLTHKYNMAERDFDVDRCFDDGFYGSTLFLSLAFYYYKILPQDERKRVYLSNMEIHLPNYSVSSRGKISIEEFKQAQQLFFKQLDSFIKHALPHGLSVAHIGLPDHSCMLVFDADNKRLEFYDSNGRDSSTGTYAYFKRNRPVLHKIYGGKIRSIWSPKIATQHEKGSCGLWATVFAMFRMAGISREYLPTDFDKIYRISKLVRTELLNACDFKSLIGKPIHRKYFDMFLYWCMPTSETTQLFFNLISQDQEHQIPADFPLDKVPTYPTPLKNPCMASVIHGQFQYSPLCSEEASALKSIHLKIHTAHEKGQEMATPFVFTNKDGKRCYILIGLLFINDEGIAIYNDDDICSKTMRFVLNGTAPTKAPKGLPLVFYVHCVDDLNMRIFMESPPVKPSKKRLFLHV